MAVKGRLKHLANACKGEPDAYGPEDKPFPNQAQLRDTVTEAKDFGEERGQWKDEQQQEH